MVFLTKNRKNVLNLGKYNIFFQKNDKNFDKMVQKWPKIFFPKNKKLITTLMPSKNISRPQNFLSRPPRRFLRHQFLAAKKSGQVIYSYGKYSKKFFCKVIDM